MKIQANFAVFAVSPDEKITYVSENISEFLGSSPADLLSARVRDLFGASDANAILTGFRTADADLATLDLGVMALLGRSVNVTACASGVHTAYCLEPLDPGHSHPPLAVADLELLFQQAEAGFADDTHGRAEAEAFLAGVRAVADYDGALLYRTGEGAPTLIAQSVAPALEEQDLGVFADFLPNPDARQTALFARLRIVADSDEPGVDLQGVPGSAPLDLTHVLARPVSGPEAMALRRGGCRAALLLDSGTRSEAILLVNHSPRMPRPDLRHILGFMLTARQTP